MALFLVHVSMERGDPCSYTLVANIRVYIENPGKPPPPPFGGHVTENVSGGRGFRVLGS